MAIQSDLGSPRIVGELHKIGIDVAKSTVEKYRLKSSKPSSPTWKAFLTNHVQDLVSYDFFTVPTATFRVLFVFIILAHDRRRIVHFNITEHPTAQWTAQQIVEAFPWEEAPRYLFRSKNSCGLQVRILQEPCPPPQKCYLWSHRPIRSINGQLNLMSV